MFAFLVAVLLFLIGIYAIIELFGAIISSTFFFVIIAILIIRAAIRK